ncbi:MAG: 50S ribosomal protein L23 [Erysipelotrichaceae bacterium]|nr:50S ribosomal protein L23 [Clostridia bacterium]MBQ6217556.1 50S ribosomal protein L23 [Erysipelotrichaceae bacterium]MBR6261176.1 50S ribosomal protein L23 [Erysipelotrichaceae bacterium]MBR6725181.1 50S ribosomal protein L23 [Erysipelotrichaceae bacterium]
MSNARDIIVRPLVTEKTIRTQEGQNTVVFEVRKGTNKVQIKQAIEEIFNVKVDNVNVVNQKPKTKRMGRYVGKTNHLKKAYVKLKEGYTIDILADK